MARRGSSFGFLGRFGRSDDLRQLDAALRAVDLHPALVPEGVKLAIANLMKDHEPGERVPDHAYPFVALIAGYCALGAEQFGRVNGAEAISAAEARIEAAIESGAGFDAEILLLLLHARLVHPKVVEDFALEAEI